MSVIGDRPVLSRALIVVLSAALMLAAAMTYSVSSFSGGDGTPAIEAEAAHTSPEYDDHKGENHDLIFSYNGAFRQVEFRYWYEAATNCPHVYYHYDYSYATGGWDYSHSSVHYGVGCKLLG